MISEPLLLTVAFQAWVTVWPLANCQVTVHDVMADVPAVTVIAAWKPPCHWPVEA